MDVTRLKGITLIIFTLIAIVVCNIRLEALSPTLEPVDTRVTVKKDRHAFNVNGVGKLKINDAEHPDCKDMSFYVGPRTFFVVWEGDLADIRAFNALLLADQTCRFTGWLDLTDKVHVTHISTSKHIAKLSEHLFFTCEGKGQIFFKIDDKLEDVWLTHIDGDVVESFDFPLSCFSFGKNVAREPSFTIIVNQARARKPVRFHGVLEPMDDKNPERHIFKVHHVEAVE